MKRHLILDAALVLLLAGNMAGQDRPSDAQPNPPQDEKLRQELLDRVE